MNTEIQGSCLGRRMIISSREARASFRCVNDSQDQPAMVRVTNGLARSMRMLRFAHDPSRILGLAHFENRS